MATFNYFELARSNMRFNRSVLEDSRKQYEASGNAELSAIGTNFRLEENVSDVRREVFEATSRGSSDLRAVAQDYFFASVQGARRRHRSSTFDEVQNGHMLLPATLEPNQKLVRLERIDDIIALAPDRYRFDRLVRALASDPRDVKLLSEFAGQFQIYSGERPAYVAFKAELVDEMREPDWLERVIRRLGLFHHIPTNSDETFHFALMEYTVAEVFVPARKLRIERPFAVGTVLECRNNPAFFPVPRGSAHGFTVDLGDGSPGLLRELLHVRMDYVHSHVVRFAAWSGPQPLPDLEVCRERHATRVRGESERLGAGVSPADGGVS